MKYLFFIIIIFLLNTVCRAQFAPQAGLAGSDAIHKDSTIIVAWATECSIIRGWQDIADTTLGKVSTGDSTSAFGMADANVVSLGDGGEAIIYFANPVINGSGSDFAVFENGFRNPADSNEAFLELAKVAVSNDGINYYTFASQCHNDTSIQIAGAGIYMDARKVRNLAGKYVTYYGTPFDLDELSMILSLDVNNIQYVKISDVVGSLAADHCSRDVENNIINDPYPTPFPTGGFDLDAVAVIHQKYATGIEHDLLINEVSVFPNPASDFINLKNIEHIEYLRIYTAHGHLIAESASTDQINIRDYAAGIYFMEVSNHAGGKQVFRFIKI